MPASLSTSPLAPPLEHFPSQSLVRDAWNISDKIIDLTNLMRTLDADAATTISEVAKEPYEKAIRRAAMELGQATLDLDAACGLLRLAGLIETATEIRERTTAGQREAIDA